MSNSEFDFLHLYLDDCDEQLEALRQTLIAWQQTPESDKPIAEFFRLLHAIEGAAGTLGLESIHTLTKHIDRQVQRIRDSRIPPDDISDPIEFLQECHQRLRTGVRLGSGQELIAELHQRRA